MIDLKPLKTSELLALYNTLTNKSTKKFSSREAGETQVMEAIKQVGACPLCAAHPKHLKIVVDETQEVHCSVCGKNSIGDKEVEASPKPKRPTENIKASWKNKKVAEARSQRNGVEVAGKQYKSVLAAFKELGLPVNKHIKFRLELKANGTAEIAGYTFKLL